jgi:hypothetical protein
VQHKEEPDVDRVKTLHGEFLSSIDMEYWEASVIVADMGKYLYEEKLTKAACKDMCRKTLWALSFGLPDHLNHLLLDLIGALGYPLLVKLLEKEAVIGKASVSAVNGELRLTSPRPRTVVAKVLRESGGRFDWTSRTWVWVASKAEDAARVIKSYFLNLEGLEETLEELKKVSPEEAQEQGLSRFLAKETEKEIWLETPYNRNFVDELKNTIPWRIGNTICRQWDSANRVWIIRMPDFIQKAKDLLIKHYL